MKKISFPVHGLSLKIFLLLSILTVFVFAIIIYINTEFYTNQIESNIRDHAIQASNLIKQSLHYSMLKNEREKLAIVISNIGKEQYIENIRIFKKGGRIEFSTDPNELNKTFDIKRDQCIICHTSDKPKGIIPPKNQFRERRSPEGERIIGLINPIENEPDCYNAACHVHHKDEKLLGYLDIKISLGDLEKGAKETRTKALIFSGILIILSTIVLGRIIRSQIQRPLSKLIDGMHQVADLNLDYTVDVNSTEDIRDMAITFNKMTIKLKRAQEELQKWSDTLEDKVKEKTKELQQAQEQLKEWSITLEDKVKEKTKELERTQQQLILAEKMASMGKLAAIVAHEINNPMSGILTYAKLSLKNLQNSTDQRVINDTIQNLQMISNESKRCGEIVKNLLLFSKQSIEKKSKCDLKSIIDRSIELVKHSIELKNIQLIKEYTEEDTIMYCDQATIEQMVVALLINAVEASPERGGELKIRLYQLDTEKKVRFEISDNGAGIPPDVLPQIFEPFYTTKESEKSTGLGLSVVYGIVEKHGGSINVNSHKNKGTTFTIDLPLNSD